jgi:tRNA(Ile)-lysidine synthase
MPSPRRPSTKGLAKLELQVLSTMEEHRMLLPGHRVTVACSGGADSTALLTVLLNLAKKFGWLVSVAHFNHQLRADESDEDERFVSQLAAQNNLPFFCDRANVRRISLRSHANLEATARRLRYEFLRSLIAHGKTDRVAVGHTADDQAETVLLRLIRGAGVRGIASVRPVLRPGIIRPLLATRGHQLRRWLKERSIEWREDGSNQDTRLRRNLVRRSILPALSKINLRVVENLAQTARLCQLDDSFWNGYVAVLAKKYAGTDEGEVRIELTALRRLPLAASHRLVQWALESASARGDASPSYEQIKSILQWAASPARRPLSLPKNVAARKDSRHLIIAATKTINSDPVPNGSGFLYQIDVPGSVNDRQVGFNCQFEYVELAGGPGAYNNSGCVFLNHSLLKFPLTLRNWKPGDAYCPNGRHKPRKLKELFQRHQVPRTLRRDWPVLESEGRIVWAKKFGVAQGFTPPLGNSTAILFTYSAVEASNHQGRE